MFCKHCGDHIKNGYCIRCGKPIGPGPMEGGIGFWDLAGKGSGGKTPPDVIDTGRLEDLISEGTERLDRGVSHIYRRQTQIHKQQTVLLTVIAVLLGIGLVLNAFLFAAVCDIRDAIPETSTEESTMPTETEAATEYDAIVEPTIPTDTAMPTEEAKEDPTTEIVQKEIIITDIPLDVPLTGTKTGREILFTIKAIGNTLTFEWQKQTLSGEWIPVDDSFLEVETIFMDMENEWKSTLYQKEFDDSLYGTYKCVIKDLDTGSKDESKEVKVWCPDGQEVEEW